MPVAKDSNSLDNGGLGFPAPLAIENTLKTLSRPSVREDGLATFRAQVDEVLTGLQGYWTRHHPGKELDRTILDGIREVLCRKNAQYGNSALEPVRIFSMASPTEQLNVRIDDKLSRLARGSGEDEDVILDLLGYLVLLRVAEK